ncbi:CinA family protein [Kribbella sp. NPDC051770]|uniref:CinA family protein n=1 Tax=Kribbella sp. NPDC051770 TaxID=3155413 RepID=UPI003430AE99
MSDPAQLTEEAHAIAEAVARRLDGSGRTVAVAESLTSGSIACQLGAATNAGAWFAGGVIAYATAVKVEVLGVDPGPVVTARCARQMARGVAALTHADFAVSVTGVGGPDPDEGRPPGTVFVAVAGADGEKVAEHHFDGEPADVVQAATTEALRMLLAAVTA